VQDLFLPASGAPRKVIEDRLWNHLGRADVLPPDVSRASFCRMYQLASIADYVRVLEHHGILVPQNSKEETVVDGGFGLRPAPAYVYLFRQTAQARYSRQPMAVAPHTLRNLWTCDALLGFPMAAAEVLGRDELRERVAVFLSGDAKYASDWKAVLGHHGYDSVDAFVQAAIDCKLFLPVPGGPSYQRNPELADDVFTTPQNGQSESSEFEGEREKEEGGSEMPFTDRLMALDELLRRIETQLDATHLHPSTATVQALATRARTTVRQIRGSAVLDPPMVAPTPVVAAPQTSSSSKGNVKKEEEEEEETFVLEDLLREKNIPLMSLDKLRILHALGCGTYGAVHLFEYVDSRQLGAIKFFRRFPASASAMRALLTEFEVARQKSNPNLVALYGLVVTPLLRPGVRYRYAEVASLSGASGHGWIGIAMEYCARGTLLDVLGREPKLTLGLRLSLLHDVASGLQRLHAANSALDSRLVHRDLKPANILIADGIRSHQPSQKGDKGDKGETKARWVAKLSDFGTVFRVEATARETVMAGGFAGTYAYAAPETMEKNKVSTQSDVYSFSLMAAEVLLHDPNLVVRDLEARGCTQWMAVAHAVLAGGFSAAKFADQVRGALKDEGLADKHVASVVEQCIVRASAKEADNRPRLTEILDTLQRAIESLPHD
jgi:serine/threonine protein kinase